LIFVLSEGDHRKSTVRDWVERHRQILERLLGQEIRPTDFTDDRLGIVLHRLSRTDAWQVLEAELWSNTVVVYDPEVTGIRVDSTTTYGYHTPVEGGVMQYGHSKDHRPDLAQVKLMTAALEGSGHMVACAVLPGQRADGALYRPVIARVRQMLGRKGLLYTGDCKMAAFATRADIAGHGDYYLVPLPEQDRETIDHWIDQIVAGDLPSAELLWDKERLPAAGRPAGRRVRVRTSLEG